MASRRLFWVAAVAGIIVFGSLMGAMLIGQQFLQNVLGYDTLEAGFAAMLIGWHDDTTYPLVGLAYLLVGAGVGFAGTPASNSLTGSVPVRRAGMASATADLQRDLGGAIMQSLLGALLTAGYARAFANQIAGALLVATRYPGRAGEAELLERYHRTDGVVGDVSS